MRRVFASLSLIAAYSRANLRSAFEYRTSFASEVLAMLVNDCMWVVFWVGFYERYPAVRGWERADVVTLWAVIATAFGIATALFGNLVRLAGIIARGELDFFLSLPRPVLLHTLIGRMSFSAYGDVVFGIAAYAWIVRPSASDWLLFTALTLSNVGIFVGFGACMASWSFWLGSAEGIAQQAMNILINFSTYPNSIFRGAVQWALLSVIPASFLGFIPVEILREHHWHWLCGHIAVSTAFVSLGAFTFQRGLRRYESGNLVFVRTT